MSELDICTISDAKLNGETNVLTVEPSRETGLDGEREPVGTAAPMVQCLGVTSVPADPSAEGHAEGVVMSPCGPYTSAVVGGTDTRCADVVGQMTKGDTALHGTHAAADKRAAVFCKENLLAILVGKDTAIVVDRGSGAITINDASGNQIEMSADNGIMLVEQGGAWLQLKGGAITMAQSGLNLAGAVSIGDATAMPIVKMPAMTTYTGALATLLTALDTYCAGVASVVGAMPGGASIAGLYTTYQGANSTFSSASAGAIAAMPTIFTKAS
jgi:hypothetical protein